MILKPAFRVIISTALNDSLHLTKARSIARITLNLAKDIVSMRGAILSDSLYLLKQ
jgi:hypothetical protein